MNARHLLILTATFLVAGLAAWLLWSGDGPVPGVGPGPAEVPRPNRALHEAAAASGTGPAQPADAPAPDRVEVEAAAAPPAALGERETLVRGRCVDEQGRPLADVSVELDGWTGNSERMAQFELDGGVIAWEDPEAVVTGPDGRFEFRIEPPPPYQFIVDLELGGRVAMRFRWHELPVGETRDVGDVTLPLGVAVHARVVDPDGVGLAAVRVQAAPQHSGSGAPRPVSYVYRTTDAGGYVHFDALPEGPVRFEVYGLSTLEPSAPVHLERPAQELRIVAVSREAQAGPSIQGIVVDEQGTPLADARLHIGEQEALPVFGNARAGRDGRFTIALPDNTDPNRPTMLQATRSGYEVWRSPEPVGWGTAGLRVTMKAGPPISLRVTSAPDGEPVERYGITLAPVRENGSWTSLDDDLLHLGEHPAGLLRIDRVTPGRYRLGVQAPAAAALDMLEPLDIEVIPGRPLALDARLHPLVARRVLVVTTDDSPVVGARVELVAHQRGGTVNLNMLAADRRNARANSPDHVVELVDAGTTDASGELDLRGAAGSDFALRLLGPGCIPQVVQPVRLDEEGPLRVIVGGGATLRGRLGPAEVLAQLRAEARPEGMANRPDTDDPPAFGVFLHRAEGEPRRFPSSQLGDSHLPIDVDGRFEALGLPPGTWSLHLLWERARVRADGTRSGSTTTAHEVLAGIELRDGEQSAVDVDLTPMRRHAVPIRSSVDGVPRAVLIALQGELGVNSSGHMQHDYVQVATTADGQGIARLGAGSWHARAQVQVGGHWVILPGPSFGVPGAAEAGIVIDARLGRRSVRVLRPDGEPAVGVELGQLPRPNDPRPGFAAGVTDRGGRTTLHGVGGSYPLAARRAPLSDARAFYAWQRAHPGVDQARAWIDLGAIELLPGAEDEFVIRLPEAWLKLPD